MAAIAFDAGAQGFTAGATSLTYSHVNAGNFVVVGIVGSTGGLEVTGVTYSGVALTPGLFVQGGTGGSTRDLYTYYLLGAPVGTANVIISASVAILIGGMSASYTNVGSAAITNSHKTAGSISTGFTTLPTPVDGCWISTLAKNDIDGTLIYGASTTGRVTNANVGAGLADNNGPAAVNSNIAQNFGPQSGNTAFSDIYFLLQPKVPSFFAVF